MKKLIILLSLIPFLSIAQNTVCFSIDPNPNTNDPALAIFSKYVDVLGCFSIYAENSIPDTKVLHAAAVAAELLDNNEDGVVDDPLIQAKLISEYALIPIFFQDGNAAMNTFSNNYNGNGVSAVLFNVEIDPTQTGHWGDDATVEEIMHTINHVGHTNVYPNAFSLQPNSSLMSTAMDIARGGQFITVPNPYPSSAWYHYDDLSCDYECMMIEYMYWAVVSYMGILDDPQTAAGIANEWEPYNDSLLQYIDVLMHQLITDPTYKLPLSAPDGNYCVNTITYNCVNGNCLDPGNGQGTFPSISSCQTNCSSLPLTYIPDDNFESYLEANGMGDNILLNDSVLTTNISSVGMLDIRNKSISDITGIEDFSALTYLDCGRNQLTSIDVHQNIHLEYLECSFNKIKNIDISNNTALTNLFVDDNELISLDLRNGNNTNIVEFYASYNPSLTCINVDDVSWSNTNWLVSNYQIDAQHYFSTNCPPSTIYDQTQNRKLLRAIDLLGRETNKDPLFYIYDDGTVEKRIKIN